MYVSHCKLQELFSRHGLTRRSTGSQASRRRSLRFEPPAADSERHRKIDRTTGDDVLKLFTYAREKQFAIPACNVTSSRFVRTPRLRPLPDTVRLPRACGTAKTQAPRWGDERVAGSRLRVPDNPMHPPCGLNSHGRSFWRKQADCLSLAPLSLPSRLPRRRRRPSCKMHPAENNARLGVDIRIVSRPAKVALPTSPARA